MKYLVNLVLLLVAAVAAFAAGRATKECQSFSEFGPKIVATDSAAFWNRHVAPDKGPAAKPVAIAETDRPVRIQLAGCAPTGRLATALIPVEDSSIKPAPMNAKNDQDSVPVPSSTGIESFLKVSGGAGWLEVTRYTSDLRLRSTTYELPERGNRFSVSATDSSAIVVGDRWHWLRDVEVRATVGINGNWQFGVQVPVSAAWSAFAGTSDKGRVAGAGYRPFTHWPQ